MQREINPPEEILRRLSYILYLALMVVTFVLGVIGLVQQRFDYLAGMLAAGVAGLGLRNLGRRHLEFERLFRSFPYGEPEDEPPTNLLQEVAEILNDSAEVGSDWLRRQELRKRLLTLLDQDPRLWQIFRREIEKVFPALADWAHGPPASDGR